MTLRTALVSLASVVFLACGSTGSSDGGSTRADTLGALTGNAAAGKTVYETNCISCHQAMGQGAPPTYPSLANYGRTQPKSAYFEILLAGRGLMSSYRSLPDQQLADVVEYAKTTFNK